MKKLPVGKQNFKEIIEDNFLYVDKTRQIYELITVGSLYFLSRPRRFGKTLLVSTIKEIFKGNQDLFKNLFIGQQTDYDWHAYPVLQFNFASINTHPKDLEESLKRLLQTHGDQYNIKLLDTTLEEQFGQLVSSIAEQSESVVILVDEYDKPIIDFLGNQKNAIKNRTTLKRFFAPLKALEEKGFIKFLFITGVSKFSKVSLFSDLNNLTDLTIHPLSTDLLGITNQELHNYFTDFISLIAKKYGYTENKLLEGIKLWYSTLLKLNRV